MSSRNLTASELYHRTCGESPKGNHSVPNCCDVMYDNYDKLRDKIIFTPPLGKGARLEIKYGFPRKDAKPTIESKPEELRKFSTLCKFCNGTGIDPDIGRNALSLSPAQKCPACNGKGQQILQGRLEDYIPCVICRGSGRDPNDLVCLKPHDICHGSGLTRLA